MEFRNFKSTDYLNYTDVNTINNEVWKVYSELLPSINVPTVSYSYYIKSLNEKLNSSEWYNINTYLIYFGNEYFKPEGWVDLDIYNEVTSPTSSQVNDWYIDLQTINDNYRQILQKNIWNIHYLLNWNSSSTIVVEWED